MSSWKKGGKKKKEKSMYKLTKSSISAKEVKE